MAKIEVILRKGNQNLGYIKLDENGEPFYSYNQFSATEMELQQAIKVVNKLSNKYFFKIHLSAEEKKKKEKAHYVLC